jgi:hypothetical protein
VIAILNRIPNPSIVNRTNPPLRVIARKVQIIAFNSLARRVFSSSSNTGAERVCLSKAVKFFLINFSPEWRRSKSIVIS